MLLYRIHVRSLQFGLVLAGICLILAGFLIATLIKREKLMKKKLAWVVKILFFPLGIIMYAYTRWFYGLCLSDENPVRQGKSKPGRGKQAAGSLALAVLIAATSVHADTSGPLEAVQTGTVEILRILDSGLGQAEAAAAVKAESVKRFDFERMTMSAVGPAWKKLDEGKRAELVRLFSDLLVRVYLDRINGNRPEKLMYQSPKIEGDKAAVLATINYQGRQIDVIYSLYFSDGRVWRIRDVNIEGVGLVTNYRSQFSDIIAKAGVDGLIAKLREKVAERRNG